MSLQSRYGNWVSILRSGQRATLREEGAFLFIRTQDDVFIIQIDGGVIPNEIQNQLSCDFLIHNSVHKWTRLVELKGVDVEHACDQIRATIIFAEHDEDLKGILDDMDLLKGYIVSPHFNVPDISNTHRTKVCQKLYDKSKHKLKTLFHHLVFVRCVPKNPGRSMDRSDNDSTKITVYNEHPLLV